MNVAILSPEYPPYTNWGGVATFNYNLAHALSRIGDTVHVITYDGVGDKKQIEKHGQIIIHYVRYKSDNRLINVLYYHFLAGLVRQLFLRIFPKLIQTIDWNIFSFFYFLQLRKTQSIDVIHCPTYHAPSLLVSLVFPSIPCILYVQGPQEYFNLYEARSLDNIVKSKVENWYTGHCAKKIVACSNNVHKKLLDQFQDLAEKMVVIPNFIDTGVIKGTSRPNLNNVVFMGRLEYRKGVDVLIRAFIALAKKNPLITLYLIGDTFRTNFTRDGKISFENAWRSLKIPDGIQKRILFYPRIDDDIALRLLLEEIKGIAVFPSRYEPFGFVTIEAMALGYIVVAGNNSGGKEIITNGVDGFLASPTHSSLLSVLRRIRTLPDKKIAQISKNAIHTVTERYSIASILRSLAVLEKSVVAHNAS